MIIYKITNKVNGKVYVGKSRNCYNRLNQHLYDIRNLERNHNENPHLLNAVNKYGIENFDYYLVEKFEKNLDYQELDEIRNEYDTEEDRAKDVVNFLKASMGEEFDEMHAHKKMESLKKKEDPIKNLIKKFF